MRPTGRQHPHKRLPDRGRNLNPMRTGQSRVELVSQEVEQKFQVEDRNCDFALVMKFESSPKAEVERSTNPIARTGKQRTRNKSPSWQVVLFANLIWFLAAVIAVKLAKANQLQAITFRTNSSDSDNFDSNRTALDGLFKQQASESSGQQHQQHWQANESNTGQTRIELNRTLGIGTFRDVTLRRRQMRQLQLQQQQQQQLTPTTTNNRSPTDRQRDQQAAGVEFKYHLSGLDSATAKAPLVSMPTEQKQQQQQSLWIQPQQIAADTRRSDLWSASVESPLQLHLKLRPLALPMPPPPSLKVADINSRRQQKRRSLADHQQQQHHHQGRPKHNDKDNHLVSSSLSYGSNKTLPTTIKRHNTMEVDNWEEAKRVLMMNSIAPPLVQAAVSRRLGRRYAILPSISTEKSLLETPDDEQQHKSGSQVDRGTNLDLELTRTHLAKLDEQRRQVSTIPSQTNDTANSVGRDLRIGQQREQLEFANNLLNSPTPFKESTLDAELAARQGSLVKSKENQILFKQVNDFNNDIQSMRSARLDANAGQNSRPFSMAVRPSLDEGRIQAMAAAMLPYVWPSFQLTTTSQSLAKFKARQPVGGSLISTTTPAVPLAWSMKYQQLERNNGASELRPTIVSMEDNNTEDTAMKMHVKRREIGASTSETSTTPMAPMAPTTTSTKMPLLENSTVSQQSAATRLEKPVRTNKKRKKSDKKSTSVAANTSSSLNSNTANNSSNGHQTNSDSTRMASKYQMPKIKFNGNSNLSTISNLSGNSFTTTESRKLLEATSSAAQRNGTSTTSAQMPKSLIKLIESQLQQANSNGNSSTSKQTAALLQILGQQSAVTSSNNQTGGKRMSSLAPSTSVSKVVRLVSSAPTQFVEIEVNSTSNSINLVQTQTTSMPKSRSSVEDHRFGPSHRRLNGTEVARETQRPTESSAERQRSLEAPTTASPTGLSTSASPLRSVAASSMEFGQPLRTEQLTSEKSVERSMTTVPTTTTSTSTTSSPTIITTTATTSSSTTTKPASESKRIKSKKFGASTEESNSIKLTKQTGHQQAKGNIKLFHFRRKPDVAKLPFYKKPLDLTELGLTAEEIERELAKQRLEGELTTEGDESAQDSAQEAKRMRQQNRRDSSTGSGRNNESQSNDDDENDDEGENGAISNKQNNGTLARSNQSSDSSSNLQLGPQATSMLLKRKRRAKNQFERLMAELQAAAAAAAATESSVTETNQASGQKTDKWPTAEGARSSEVSPEQAVDELVPVLRKKQAPLIMKPMFFVMNQKRRNSSMVQEQSGQPTSGVATNSTTAPPTSSNETRTAVSMMEQRNPILITSTTKTISELEEREMLLRQRSKPIVRKRRKHHGDQPSAALMTPSVGESLEQIQEAAPTSPWRPSKPAALDWTPAASQQLKSAKLVLVPSGLLTPSGSHPMPLFAATSSLQNEPNLLWSQQAPSSSKPNDLMQAQQQQNSFVVAPSSSITDQPAQVAQGEHQSSASQPAPQAQQQQQQQSIVSQLVGQNGPQVTSASTSELRVPKLLVKPMRPAKYSLNGYIPKPSLSNTLVANSNSNSNSNQPLQAQQTPLATGNQSNGPKSGQKLAGQTQVVMQATRSQPFAVVSQASNRPTVNKAPTQKSRPQNSAAQSSLMEAAAVVANLQSKDLDSSSTSNEIFSHRRGFQQARQLLQAQAGRSTVDHDSLTVGSSQAHPLKSGQQTLINVDQDLKATQHNDKQQQRRLSIGHNQLVSSQLEQLEANRRKYVKQHQASSAFKSPTLTLNRVNQIKAKLGLSASPSFVSSRRTELPFVDNQQQTSIRSITTLDPGDNLGSISISRTTDDESAGSSNKQLIGAPLNSIPKTDFECTDNRGRFVSGLFADTKTGCQVWHLCSNNRKYSFLCPSGTIFNAKVRICDWRYNVKCE